METENDRNASNVNIEVDGPVEKFKQNQRNTKAKEPLTLRSPFVHVEGTVIQIDYIEIYTTTITAC